METQVAGAGMSGAVALGGLSWRLIGCGVDAGRLIGRCVDAGR